MGSGCGSVVMRSTSTSEIRGSNPVIGKLLSNICLLSTVLPKAYSLEGVRTKIKKKERPGMAQFFFIKAAQLFGQWLWRC